MKRLLTLTLYGVLAVGAPGSASGLYNEDNPFVEAMLRMMEVFGLIDRNSLPLGVPYLPSYAPSMASGMGGIPGLSGYPGMATLPGMSPMYGLGGFPGMGQFPGATGWPGGLPNAGNLPGNWGGGQYGAQRDSAHSGYLDGIWELTNGGFVIVKRNAARLYLSRERFQDFTIGYDRQRLWWTPRGGNTTTTYRYQMRDGRMILRDNEGQILLMRRRS